MGWVAVLGSLCLLYKPGRVNARLEFRRIYFKLALCFRKPPRPLPAVAVSVDSPRFRRGVGVARGLIFGLLRKISFSNR